MGRCGGGNTYSLKSHVTSLWCLILWVNLAAGPRNALTVGNTLFSGMSVKVFLEEITI